MKISSPALSAIRSMIRVNQAGEIGANRIYEGQRFILGNTAVGPLLQHMQEQEVKHLNYFNDLVKQYHVRPTLLYPFWNIFGWALGAGTALLGKEAAMACTEAVETAVGNHYNDQLRYLAQITEESENIENSASADYSLPIEPLSVSLPETVDVKSLRRIIKECRDEELEHLDIAVENDALKSPFYSALSSVIITGCKTAIAIAKVV